MLKKVATWGVCLALALTMLPASQIADARWGVRLPGVYVPRLRVPRVDRVVRGIVIVPHRTLVRAVGIVAVTAVGVVVLSGLTRTQRIAVARRTDTVVRTDPDREVTDTYKTDDGSKTIKITAAPSQPASSFRDDPALKVADMGDAANDDGKPKSADAGPKGEGTGDTAMAENKMEPSSSGKTADNKESDKSKSGQKDAKGKTTAANDDSKSQLVKMADVPADASCRKVQTEFTSVSKKKDKEEASDTPETSTNTAIMCRMADGDWKPVTL